MTGEVILTVENGPLLGKTYVFKDRQVCVLGRADDCDIWIPGTGENLDISRHHCVLEIDPPNVSVRDLGSLNGTWVNGEPVGWLPGEPGKPWKGGLLGESRSLGAGDELRVGHVLFRVRTGLPEDCPPLLVEEIHKAAGNGSAWTGPKRHKKAPTAPAVLENVDLDAWTAADLMTPQIISVPATASLGEVTAILMANRVSAVLVNDANGQPAGVLSQTDLLAHDCKDAAVPHAPTAPAQDTAPAEPKTVQAPAPKAEALQAGDLMTPLIFSVPVSASGAAVVTALLSLQVHRLFVTDPSGSFVGVISRTDVLRRLHRSPPRRPARPRELAAPVQP